MKIELEFGDDEHGTAGVVTYGNTVFFTFKGEKIAGITPDGTLEIYDKNANDAGLTVKSYADPQPPYDICKAYGCDNNVEKKEWCHQHSV